MEKLLRPARTDTFEHTITGLLSKRADLYNEAERIRDRPAEIKNDIGAVDRTLGVLGYQGDLDAAMPRQKREVIFGKGELTKAIYGELRHAPGPLTSRDIAREIVTMQGNDARDRPAPMMWSGFSLNAWSAFRPLPVQKAVPIHVTVLRPLHALIEHHVLAADRLHGDDTTVPILAKSKTTTGRAWVYVRDYAHSMIMRSSPGHLSSFLRQISEMVASIRTRASSNAHYRSTTLAYF